MDPTNPVEAIFFTALAKPPELRAAYLAEACGQDAELRRKVETLLATQPQVGQFLERPAGVLPPANALPTIDRPAPDGPGVVLTGKYQLLEEIGEGGMGTVWKAQQTEPVRRMVAVKLIKPGMDTKLVLARFEAERQALALMDHPNIAKVLDAGTTGESGRPFFVMELVKGVPITKYCDEHHLTPRQRLELFVPVCHAIQHAHLKGVIHRDLKPSNVLVALYDDRPIPKVIDFGVAKAAGQPLTDQTLQTGFGAVVGTVEYMSPEQAGFNQLDIDTRSDIYSLGVLLYELLTGSPPFTKKELETAGMVEMLRVIREQEPSKPSTKLNTADGLPTLAANRGTEPTRLAKLVRGELDWIVMKALEKDRNRRYETANGFAMDVQRFLADEPVQACPPSTWYRLRKFVHRNKASVTASALIVLALVGGVVGTSVGLVRALEAEKSARTAEENERKAKLEAERNLEQAVKAADTFFTRVSESKLLDKPALQPFRKELLEEAQKHYLELFNKRPDDPKLKAELAASYLRMVIVLTALEEGPKAAEAMEKGLGLIERLVQEHPGDRELVARLAGVWKVERPMFRGWADGLARCRMPNGLKTLERMCDLWKKFVDDFPDLADLQGDYATLLMYQGDISWQEERYRDCQRFYEAADARFTKLAQRSPLSCEYRINAASARMGVAWHLSCFGQVRDRESLEKCAESIKMFEDLLREFPEKPIVQLALLGVQVEMIDYFKYTSQPEEAEALQNRMIEGAEKLYSTHPDVPGHAIVLSYLYADRISAEESKGRIQVAEAGFRKCLDALEVAAAYYPDNPQIQAARASQYGGLGMFHLRRGNAERALQLSEYAVSILQNLGAGSAEDHSVLLQLGALHLQMATIHRGLARLTHAETAYRAAIAHQSRFLRKHARIEAVQDPDLHGSCAGLYDLLKSAGRIQEADDFIRQTIGDWEKLARADPEKYEFQIQVAQSYSVAGKWDKAAEEYGKAISKWPHRMNPWRGRASAYSKLGKYEQALQDYTSLIDLGYRDHGSAWMYDARASAYRALKQDDKALADLTYVTEQWPFLVDAWMWRANLYRDLGQWGKAIDDYSKAIALKPEHMPAWQARFLAYVKLNQGDNAAADLKKIAEHPSQDPSHRDLVARAHYELGILQWRSGETVAAARNLRQAAELWTKLAADVPAEPVYLEHAVNVFLYPLGSLLQQTGRATEAEQFLATALLRWTSLARQDREQHRNALADATGIWARLLCDGGKHQQAEQLAAKLVEQWPENARALIARGRVRLALNQPDKALEDFTKAIELAPHDGMSPWWWLDRSAAYAGLKQEDKALAELTQATERWPELWDAWVWRGNFHFDRHRWKDAVPDYTRALDLNPGYAPAWRNRGYAAIRLADWDQATQAYDKAIALQPKNANLHHELAWLLAHCPDQKACNPKRAVELARHAVELEPKNGAYRGTLGSALYRAEDWKAAIEELNLSIKLGRSHGADMLFLAMAHQRLDQNADARDWYDQAIAWVAKNAPKDDELRRFRDEARALMKLKD